MGEQHGASEAPTGDRWDPEQCPPPAGSLSWGSGAAARTSGLGRLLGRMAWLLRGTQGHGWHHATGSTVPEPQTWEQDLGPPCKCKGSCGLSCSSISSHGPCAAHVGTGITADLLLHGVLRAPPHPHCSALPLTRGHCPFCHVSFQGVTSNSLGVWCFLSRLFHPIAPRLQLSQSPATCCFAVALRQMLLTTRYKTYI